MTKVYGWMSFAMFLTALMAWTIAGSETALSFIFGNKFVFWGLIIGELALVWIISASLNRLSLGMISFLFVFYSLLNGATLSSIFLAYTAESIASAFLVTGLTFGAVSLYGFTTKKDLSGMGSILFMALIGLIIASVVNIFWANSVLNWIITYAGVLIFVGLTAYDTQKLKRMSYQIQDGQTAGKFAIGGALSLYLDFINLFLFFLRIFGNNRN
ncbi:MAG: Bax inhibitor-1/YccA family protein [Prevotellaceae bacterium]|nr:Bax inhibitor-1/YccA family protein [Prevotellaceae bacterium]